MPDAEPGNDLGRSSRSRRPDRQHWAIVKGGLVVAALLAAAAGHEDLSLLAQVLVAVGDAVISE